MANLHDTPGALQALQADIYREKILQARKLTLEQRLAHVFELSNHQFGMMLSGAMHRVNTQDAEIGWKEVCRWMKRLDKVRDHGFYTTTAPDNQ